MSAHPLADIAWNVNDLLLSPPARKCFLDHAIEYIEQRQRSRNRPPALPLPDDDDEDRAYTPTEKYAVLAALHFVVCRTEGKIDPAPWSERAEEQTVQRLKKSVSWQALVASARDLDETHCGAIQAMLTAVQDDLASDNAGTRSLNPTAATALKIIKRKNGKGITGKELVAGLKKVGFEISLATLQKHIVPILKEHGVQNIKALGGYFIDGLSAGG